MQYNKLVRDKIPQIIKGRGFNPVTHIANDNEYWQGLKNKLQEEIEEFLEDDGNIEEIADIMEVLDAIFSFKNIDRENIEKIRIKKSKEKGAFQKKIILESVE